MVITRALAAFGLVLFGFVGWTGFQLWQSWQDLGRLPWDLDATEANLATIPMDAVPTEDGAAAPPPAERAIDNKAFDSLLIVGSDSQAVQGGNLADVIMLFLLPDQGRPAVVSIPRDLWVQSPCRGTFTKINANLRGCGDDATGPELLALAVQEFTGVEVDHFALFDFEGFSRVIDGVGGIQICVDNPVRDAKAQLDLPAGCTQANGEQALSWVRSRRTEELVDGVWRAIPGVSDLTRNEKQQDVIFQLLAKLNGFRSLGDLTETVQRLADAFTVDAALSIPDAIRFAWQMRDLEQEEFTRLTLEVEDFVSSDGQQALRATRPFEDILAEEYPQLAESLTAEDTSP